MRRRSMEKIAGMAVRPNRAFASPARLLHIGLAAAAAVALAGCDARYASSDPVFPGDFAERHPIVVASAPTTLDLYPVGGALDERSIKNIHAFAERYRHFGAGAVTISTPPGVHPNSTPVRAVRNALAGAGLNGRIVFATAAAPNDGAAPTVRLSFVGLKAIVPTRCGQWPEDLASGSSTEGWRNESYSNFGCATQSIIAAQVDDPRDFIEARALGSSDTLMRMRAIEAVRNGQDPGTQWKDTVLIPIGGDLPSNGN